MSNPLAIGSDRASESDGSEATVPAAGWWLNFIAGFVPLAAGFVVLVTNWVGVARADSAWWTALGTLDFSYSSLRAAGSDAPRWVELIGSVGGVNVVAAAIAVSVVARFGLRDGQLWAWWFLAFCFLWVGVSRCGYDDAVLRCHRSAVHAASLRVLRAHAGGTRSLSQGCLRQELIVVLGANDADQPRPAWFFPLDGQRRDDYLALAVTFQVPRPLPQTPKKKPSLSQHRFWHHCGDGCTFGAESQ